MFLRLSRRLTTFCAIATLAGACSPPLSNLSGELPSATALRLGPATPAANTPVARPTPTSLPRAVARSSGPRPTATVPALGQPMPATFAPQLAVVERQISALRELPPLRPLVQRRVSKAELRDYTLRALEPDGSKATQQATFSWLLRLAARNSDQRAAQADFYAGMIGGGYDDERGQILLLDSQDGFGPWQRTIYAHELVHALQDQHYNLRSLLSPALDGDQLLARRALVEGDAMVVEGAYYWQHLSAADRQAITATANSLDSDARARTAPYLVERCEFPYTAGVDFVMALWRQGKWKAVDDALADPPSSSEQILHPEKYLESPRDEPLAVSLPDLAGTLGSGWSETLSDTLGELELRTLLRATGAPNAEQAAAGWGGARYSLWQQGDQALTLVETRWDSELDAGEFASALHQTLRSARQEGNLFVDGGRYIALLERGSRVTLISGNDRAAVLRVLAHT